MRIAAANADLGKILVRRIVLEKYPPSTATNQTPTLD